MKQKVTSDLLQTISSCVHQIILDHFLWVSGELHTYEALSSDTHKNVLSALQRLDTVTKSRAWVTRLAPANLFGFKLIFWGAWEAVWISDARVKSSPFCFLTAGLNRMNTQWIKQLSEESMTYFVSQLTWKYKFVFEGIWDKVVYLNLVLTVLSMYEIWCLFLVLIIPPTEEIIYFLSLSSLTVAGKIPPQMLHTTPEAKL